MGPIRQEALVQWENQVVKQVSAHVDARATAKELWFYCHERLHARTLFPMLNFSG